jgi:hypothetical protein
MGPFEGAVGVLKWEDRWGGSIGYKADRDEIIRWRWGWEDPLEDRRDH